MQKQRITIEMIESTDFRIRARGYDQQQVATMLDAICDQMEADQLETDQLKQDLIHLQREIESLKNNGAPVVEEEVQRVRRGPDPQSVQAVFEESVRFREQSIHETETKCKEMLEAARQQADEISAKAEAEAEGRLAAIHEEHDRLSRQVEGLRQAAGEYRESFYRLMEQQKEALEKAAELFD